MNVLNSDGKADEKNDKNDRWGKSFHTSQQ